MRRRRMPPPSGPIGAHGAAPAVEATKSASPRMRSMADGYRRANRPVKAFHHRRADLATLRYARRIVVRARLILPLTCGLLGSLLPNARGDPIVWRRGAITEPLEIA